VQKRVVGQSKVVSGQARLSGKVRANEVSFVVRARDQVELGERARRKEEGAEEGRIDERRRDADVAW